MIFQRIGSKMLPGGRVLPLAFFAKAARFLSIPSSRPFSL
jgi:hypothetical protein